MYSIHYFLFTHYVLSKPYSIYSESFQKENLDWDQMQIIMYALSKANHPIHRLVLIKQNGNTEFKFMKTGEKLNLTTHRLVLIKQTEDRKYMFMKKGKNDNTTTLVYIVYTAVIERKYRHYAQIFGGKTETWNATHVRLPVYSSAYTDVY